MYLTLNYNPYTIKETTKLFCNLDSEPFCALTIGKDSYIVKATVETGLNMDENVKQNGGVYNLQIGKYVSMAEDILLMVDMNHDYLSAFLGCISEFKDKPSQKMKLKRKGQILIENDVWIGHGATIMSGVTIHHGAIVAANATVTKDVPPYAIVAGNPARVIKYRFAEEIIEKLLKISWWNWSSNKISERYEDFCASIEEFVEKYYPEAMEIEEKAEKEENPVAKMGTGKKYLLVPDFYDKYPLYPKIIREFCENFNGSETQLVIYLQEKCEAVGYEKIMKCLESLKDYTVCVQIIAGSSCKIESVIRNVDYYITDRGMHTIEYVEMAEKYHIHVISGVDIPVF